ncbi:hypothetical protein ABZ816_15855 [Actinosynnema sp. NPDC047251]|uniref:Uncharacterized protein n=1 Tax=Saccharothrix espanaensis (strain ATCC 51144 / DSM 44229 / JCM 9112 / NBRC 15066 / NRRL 15764) TaxID=1179773 RepID=K0JQB4_SACES|nr:hypothetical protein [Saccharothrix espanaensis]CCH29505.1 hypothetical protein BN6_21830 [Saccharothrix espanaensis DSM 44229]
MTNVAERGPGVVWHGPEGRPVVVVLDPAGEAPRGDLPPTWRPLAERLRIAWCRLPAEAAGFPDVDEVLDGRADRVHVVVGGRATAPALAAAADRADVVRAVLVVDPVDDRADGSGASWWEQDAVPLRRRLDEVGIAVRCFVSGDDDPAVRVDHPVPLGHPDVVGRVVEFLAAHEVVDGLPEAWEEVRAAVAEPLERARRQER